MSRVDNRRWYSKTNKCICGEVLPPGQTKCNHCRGILDKIDERRRKSNNE
ncbi:MAG: hypothetical protein ACQEQD_04495 [Bacillota bacterium]